MHSGCFPADDRRESRARERSDGVPQASQTLDTRGRDEYSTDCGRSCEAGAGHLTRKVSGVAQTQAVGVLVRA